MAPVVDLSELQRVVGQYSEQHRVIVAAGPITVASLARACVTKNKFISGAIVAGGAWLAIQGLAGPSLKLMQEQFGYLQSLLGGFGGY